MHFWLAVSIINFVCKMKSLISYPMWFRFWTVTHVETNTRPTMMGKGKLNPIVIRYIRQAAHTIIWLYQNKTTTKVTTNILYTYYYFQYGLKFILSTISKIDCPQFVWQCWKKCILLWICRKCLSSKRHILRIANILFSVRILFTRTHRTIQRWLNTLLDVMIVCSKFNRNIRYCPGIGIRRVFIYPIIVMILTRSYFYEDILWPSFQDITLNILPFHTKNYSNSSLMLFVLRTTIKSGFRVVPTVLVPSKMLSDDFLRTSQRSTSSIFVRPDKPNLNIRILFEENRKTFHNFLPHFSYLV